MIILGLSHLSPSVTGHDSTAALIDDGIIRSAVSEERFSRIKHDGGLQACAIRYCLEEAGIRLSDIDKVSVGFGLAKEHMDSNSKQQFSALAKMDDRFRKTPLENKKPIFYNHQYTHARTGYSLSNFHKAVIVSLDGLGYDDGKSNSGGIFVTNDDGEIEQLSIFSLDGSLGVAYGSVTEICGFDMLDGEGKTMTLAAYGEKEHNDEKTKVYEHIKRIFPKFKGIEYMEGGVPIPLMMLHHDMPLIANHDMRLEYMRRIYKKEVIAWAAQKVMEEIVIDIITNAVELTGIKNVVLTGGVFLNMIMNMKIRENLGKKYNFFFNPICNDVGNAVGAAIEQYHIETGKNLTFPNMPLFLGPSYDNGEVLAAIRRLGLKYEKTDKVQTAINCLRQGKVIGWFQGRSELGPRGLGNRSVLSLATDNRFKDIVNNKVKKREPWRPFCPTIIKEKSMEFLENPTEAPYMILGFQMKDPLSYQAVSHIDGSCRPQILSRNDNPEFYDVTKGLDGIVLNTSFNLAGDPIVEDPMDALMTFRYTDMDALIINDFLITH